MSKTLKISISAIVLTALAYLIQGGNGCISVTANIAPKLCSELQNHWKNKEIDKEIARAVVDDDEKLY